MADIGVLLGDKGCDLPGAVQLALADREALGTVLDGLQAIAVQLLAGLAGAEGGRRFAGLADRYFALLDDESVMVARYCARAAARVAKAAPGQRGLVRAKLLGVEATHHEARRRALVIADAIAFLTELREGPDAEVEEFVRAAMTGSSPKTRAAAKDYFKTVPR